MKLKLGKVPPGDVFLTHTAEEVKMMADLSVLNAAYDDLLKTHFKMAHRYENMGIELITIAPVLSQIADTLDGNQYWVFVAKLRNFVTKINGMFPPIDRERKP